MRSSLSRAIPIPPRERRLREASLSGARALTRLLVALIENLGAQDRAGARPAGVRVRAVEPGWPHGTTRSAFGPTPLGDEIETIMAAPTPSFSAVRPDALIRRPQDHHRDTAQTREPQQAMPEEPAAGVPFWQQPFFAAPGVRYMRTPDHILRRTRAPIAPADLPIEPVDQDLIDDALVDDDLPILKPPSWTRLKR